MKIRFSLSNLIVVVLLAVVTTYVITASNTRDKLNDELTASSAQLEKVSRFLRARADILDNFIGDISEQALMDGAIHGMIEALDDPYSHYLPAAEYDAYLQRSKKQLVGVGLSVITQADGLLVTEVYSDSPAESWGIVPGDLITDIEGRPVSDMSLDLAMSYMQGEEGTAVTFTVVSSGKALRTVSPVRALMNVQAVFSEILQGQNLGYIRVRNFNAGVGKDFVLAVSHLLEAEVDGLIFDMRGNPGGSIQELCEALDFLLPEGPIIITRNNRGVEHTEMSSASEVDLPMAVLIDRNTYSAAEFFAAALREYDKAILIGEATTGKGYAQDTIALNEDAGLLLSILEYFTPQGHSLAHTGLTPDRNIAPPTQTPVYPLPHEQDTPLQTAITLLEDAVPAVVETP